VVVKKNQSALLAKYFSMYKKNPRSKVFAPLAESFRKLGMLEDAFKVLKDGIRHHPNYTLGYIVLAHCYYDQGKFELTYNTLRPIVSQNADNISLQKIFAQACINLGYLEEALDTYKYLLFMNPKDKFFAENVKKLEDDLMVGHKRLSLDQLIKYPDNYIESAEPASDDDWVQVDFNKNPEITSPSIEDKSIASSNSDEWVMKKPGFQDHPILKNEAVQERDLEDDYYADEFEEDYGDIEEVNSQSVESDAPFVSHTLIDLYCAQKYYDKALELLDKILELNPHDQSTIEKRQHVIKLKSEQNPQKDPVTEQDGHDELISIIENQVKAKTPKELMVEKKFHHFLDALKERAQER
jgi:pentatricopeptide repeat protein